ncbi:aminotransferase class IV [Deminuibacter soli]|uniref:branched-chain-amino-acid transaminase n=1 Tax=Deminuibacter soli TaxID=2291815 RepID=A0A3E1NDT5_9BACT|nr:aminotransferase class IV [Deminuibacter soli]RFM26133.1 hypothetical protein DXN05_21245 [Deminuibacter soli]
MDTGHYMMLNGKILPAETACISADNRSFRYGDGFFETMKMLNGVLVLGRLHMERLFASLDTLLFQKPPLLTAESLQEEVLRLVQKNRHQRAARIRITVFRGDGGLYDAENLHPNILIQSWELPPAAGRFNENGLVTGVYTRARKAADDFSHVKSNNYLCYVMAALWAKQQQLNDALLLNTGGRLADATIANIFVVHEGIVKTPAITEGCVGGVMRRHLLAAMHAAGIPAQETRLEPEVLREASEVFLTNSINGIRWVHAVNDQHYRHKVSFMLYNELVLPAWAH